MRDAILTDGSGRPIERPDPKDYKTTTDFLRAFSAYKDRISDIANRAFDEKFSSSLRRGRRSTRS